LNGKIFLILEHQVQKMAVEIIEVKSRKHLREFIYLPAKIHKNHKNWVPPIYIDEWQYFNPFKNRSFNYCDTILLLAMRGNKAVGRVMGIINHKYNKTHNEDDGRFYLLETYDEQDIAHALLKTVEKWAGSKKMRRLVGPLGFSDKDPQGMLIEGFEEPIVIAANCNYPYQVRYVENAGYTKHADLLVYKIIIPDEIPDFYKKIYERGIKSNNIHIHEFTSHRQLRPFIRPVLNLLNQTYSEIYAFSPLNEQEMDDIARRYFPILNPRFIKVVVNKNNEVISFIIGMPNISHGIRSCKGHIFPFGFLKILYYQKRSRQLDLLLGGIRTDYQNLGIDAVMGVKMIEEARKAGLEYIDSHLILETNAKMKAEVERMNGTVYKKYRIFKKDLVSV
jgi:GNAT superfamily N-acetyltransferase